MMSRTNRVVGLKQSRKAVRDGLAEYVIIARDADERVRLPFERLCAQSGVRVEYADTCAGLGKACGIDVGAAVAAALKP
ncbi:MAG: ribosomal L7Ae/L30e/S12e/Gadd45 family protein [Oscillospiraceae bacterium]|nr:ribosomal L7Ae/L30e/S12e/Gadd45 family protein [Oscillospiraceae bacterium]